eukprot:IDg15926t1
MLTRRRSGNRHGITLLRFLNCECIRVSVDGTEFSVFEPYSFDTGFYLHNLERAEIRYEVNISLDGDIVWVNRPFQSGSCNDISIFRFNLKVALDLGERVVSDGGYSDERCTSLKTFTQEGHAFESEIRARHETVNAFQKV